MEDHNEQHLTQSFEPTCDEDFFRLYPHLRFDFQKDDLSKIFRCMCGHFNGGVVPEKIELGLAAIYFAIICKATGHLCAPTPTEAHDAAIGLEAGGLARGLEQLLSLDMVMIVEGGYLLKIQSNRVGGEMSN